MNFVISFILELSGMEEQDSFRFMIDFWTKKTNLYFGMYVDGFLLLRFLTYSYHKLLKEENHELEVYFVKNKILDELWIFQWFLTLFSQTSRKEFLLRIFDYLIINDCFGLVYIALEITEQIKKMILNSPPELMMTKLKNLDDVFKEVDFY